MLYEHTFSTGTIIDYGYNYYYDYFLLLTLSVVQCEKLSSITQPDRPVLDLPTPEGCKAELTEYVVLEMLLLLSLAVLSAVPRCLLTTSQPHSTG